MDRKDKVEGEGSYSGTKEYNKRTEEFVKSGKVDEAARAAKPQSEEEAHQMQKAERIGVATFVMRGKALQNPDSLQDDPNFPRKKN